MSALDGVFSFFRRLIVSDARQRVDNFASDSGERVDEGSVLGLSSAWACVNLLAGTIGSLPFMVYRTSPTGIRTEARDHPLYRILHDAPNAEQTSLDFWEGGAASIELKGNMVARKMRGSIGQIVGLEPMAWDYTSVQRENGVLVYRQGSDKFTAEDVLHVRGFGGSPLGGLSTIAFGSNAFGMARSVDRAAGIMFRNGVRPSGVLSTDSKLDGTKRKLLEELIQEKFAGAMNTGRPMLLDNGLKWGALTINPNDAQMLESRNFGVEETCRMFGVPPHLIGHTAGNTQLGSSIEEQTLGFQVFTLRKRLRRIELAVQQQLLTPADVGAGVTVEFNMDGILRGDSEARSAFYASGLQNGWLTINEVRRMENLPPVPGGDVPHLQMQQIPITQAITPSMVGHNGGPPIPPGA
jgi:HK97 family phage portal protein